MQITQLSIMPFYAAGRLGSITCQEEATAINPKFTKEPATGIPFPTLICDGMSLMGVGVRVTKDDTEVKLYAVGAYFDHITLQQVVKHDDGIDDDKETSIIERVLLDPATHPRIIRIVLNRSFPGTSLF